MAVSKNLKTVTLSMVVENGVDSKGSPVTKKVNYTGVKLDALPESIYAVASAISALLAVGTKSISLVDSSDLEQI